MNMMKVQGHSNLVRDMTTGAILNVDDSQRNIYLKQKKSIKQKDDQINTQQIQIDNLLNQNQTTQTQIDSINKTIDGIETKLDNIDKTNTHIIETLNKIISMFEIR